MDILYLSSMCSDEKYKYLLERYKTVSSHSTQRYGTLLIDGIQKNGARASVISRLLILPYMTKKKLFKKEYDGLYTYISRLNFPLIGNFLAVLCARNEINKWQKAHNGGVVLCDTIVGELTLGLFLCGHKCTRVALVTDIPLYRAERLKNPFKIFSAYLKKQTIEHFDKYIYLSAQMGEVVNKKRKPHITLDGLVSSDDTMPQQEANPKKICIMAGLLHRQYGTALLLDAFCSEQPCDTELHFYGNGDCVEEIREVQKTNPQVKYMGELANEKILEEERNAALLINPRSADEYTKYSFPSKNLEYMASGTPLLCVFLPCMEKEYRKYIYTFKSGDASDLQNKLSEILAKTHEERRQFGEVARKWVVSNKNNVLQTKKIIDFIKE